MFDFLEQGSARYIYLTFGKADRGNITETTVRNALFPNRRAFNIDVGNMDESEIEQYMKDLREVGPRMTTHVPNLTELIVITNPVV